MTAMQPPTTPHDCDVSVITPHGRDATTPMLQDHSTTAVTPHDQMRPLPCYTTATCPSSCHMTATRPPLLPLPLHYMTQSQLTYSTLASCDCGGVGICSSYRTVVP